MSAKSPARSALREGAPPSSPRLPSPPPLPELQLGPRSPAVNAPVGELSIDSAAIQDDGAARRIRPGTSAIDMARGPPFLPLHQLESPFQLQEYLKSSYAHVTRDEHSDTIKPITKESAMQLASPPIQQDTGEPVDRNLWLYELCRFLVQRTNRLIVSFFADNPPCSNQTCPEMRASEWQYLCAVHEPPKSCCAIDYCCHTLDWAANVLTSTKHFPSRLSLGGEGGSAYQSMRQLTNIFRRVYRIYAHAWFQHREAFWMLEQEEGLYKFFRTVCDAYTLIPEDNYTIPAEAEGERDLELETAASAKGEMHILRNDTPIEPKQHQQQPPQHHERGLEPSTPTTPAPAPTQRRHRHTPSTGTSVNPIAEGEENEDNNTTQISQLVVPEPTATSTKAALSSPPKTRSPRPEMSIPISQPKTESFLGVEDTAPTPTPESHAENPFSESSTLKATDTQAATAQEEEEQPSTVTQTNPPRNALSEAVSPLSTKATPPLQTQIQKQELSPEEDQEVLSPGGGSIRTVSNDILSGLMAHHDEEGDGQNPFEQLKSDAISSAATSAPTNPATSDSGVEDAIAPVNTDSEDAKSSEHIVSSKDASEEKGAEADEEMGEIKLERMETAIKNEPSEHTTGKELSASKSKHDTHETTDETHDDGTKKEETAAGVV